MLVPILVLCLSPYVLARRAQPDYDLHDMAKVKELFEDFKLKYNRTYAPGEEMERFIYFYNDLKEIKQWNHDNPLALFDINMFSDWSPEEHKTLTGGFKAADNYDMAQCQSGVAPSTQNAPDALDWRDRGVVAPVQNQGQCGSCWAFSATGAVEGAYAIKHNQLPKLSEQQLVDCDEQSQGCVNGNPHTAMSKLIDEGGQESEDDYPYQAVVGQCAFDNNKAKVQVTGCKLSKNINEDQIKEMLSLGPLSITLDGDAIKQNINPGGIFDDCGHSNINHAVLLVGYGEEAGTPFWIIKNSWGAGWADQGFLKIKRGVGCVGIGNYVAYPEVA